MLYPNVIYFRDIRKNRRICCECGRQLHGRGEHLFITVDRGQYLCRECESKWTRKREDGNTGLIKSPNLGGRVELFEDHALVVTSSGDEFHIDRQDADICSRYAWCRKKDGYAHANINGKKVSMHRFLFADMLSPGMEVDHINGDPADNRRSNLRICTHAENGKNLKHLPSVLGVTGVLPSGNKYQAHIRVNGKHKHLGTFDTVESARKARLLAEKEFYGEFAPSLSRTEWRGPQEGANT